ncbi:hypothetical protein CEUSTIGMA_g6202.t1 [Chlamydomonas eustigma]|uniref:Tyrosine specific protein phosphatases domain-containing protein n=1 Tax=Chlamydomonas eustigma TaxID=1157962 RepID=A0A250X6S7_9CHLO|nr:hypothetical protein CEUSTIGMA_g6202.t1 [Chlamydomonas eustigma]|eukprot:GAX78765.1 hypothetical protein CEUSTIGMA_g6202.t1 [Chlamydomonas eustigma]
MLQYPILCYVLQGKAFFGLGQVEGAAAAFQQGLDTSPPPSRVLSELGGPAASLRNNDSKQGTWVISSFKRTARYSAVQLMLYRLGLMWEPQVAKKGVDCCKRMLLAAAARQHYKSEEEGASSTLPWTAIAELQDSCVPCHHHHSSNEGHCDNANAGSGIDDGLSCLKIAESKTAMTAAGLLSHDADVAGERQTLPACLEGPLDPRSRYTVVVAEEAALSALDRPSENSFVRSGSVRSVLLGAAIPAGQQTAAVTLPRNTSWLIQGRLMASSTPKSRDQILAFAHLGVGVVITLTEETPLPASWFHNTTVSNQFVPVPNYHPPSERQMDLIMESMEKSMAAGLAVLVHCGGGKGRAGTVIACFMCKHGMQLMSRANLFATAAAAGMDPQASPVMTAGEAVKQLRTLRPGSIETKHQEEFVGTYSGLLWERYNRACCLEGAGCGTAASSLMEDTANTAAVLVLQQESAGHNLLSKPIWESSLQTKKEEGTGTTFLGQQQVPLCGIKDTTPPAQAQASMASAWKLPSGYPRTPHLPFSPQVAADDVILPNSCACSQLLHHEVIITEKMDGGNCFIHRGSVFARSMRQEASHESFSMAKAAVAEWGHLLPDHLAIVAENMQGIHSIEYKGLTSPLYLLAVWDCSGAQGAGCWGSWDQVEAVAVLIGLPTVPVLFRGEFNSTGEIQRFMDDRMARFVRSVTAGEYVEGFVIRRVCSMSAAAFGHQVAKYVRRGHNQTDKNWTRTWRQAVIHKSPHPNIEFIPSGLKESVEQLVLHHDEVLRDCQEVNSKLLPAVDTSSKDIILQQWPEEALCDYRTSVTSVDLKSSPQITVEVRQDPPRGCKKPSSKGTHHLAVAGNAVGTSSPTCIVTHRLTRQPRSINPLAAAQGSRNQKLPKLLMLVGLPGSGKSAFAEALVASGCGWVRVSQDECGGRRAAEQAFGIAALRGSDKGRHVILDRCNATVEDRRTWLDLALIGKRDKGVVAVYFDVSPEECINRVENRLNHPTLPPHRGMRAVTSFASVMQPPVMAEGFEKIIVIKTFEDANTVLSSFGSNPAAYPRQMQS